MILGPCRPPCCSSPSSPACSRCCRSGASTGPAGRHGPCSRPGSLYSLGIFVGMRFPGPFRLLLPVLIVAYVAPFVAGPERLARVLRGRRPAPGVVIDVTPRPAPGSARAAAAGPVRRAGTDRVPGRAGGSRPGRRPGGGPLSGPAGSCTYRRPVGPAASSHRSPIRAPAGPPGRLSSGRGPSHVRPIALAAGSGHLVSQPRLLRGVPGAGARGPARLAGPDGAGARPVPRPGAGGSPGPGTGGGRRVPGRGPGRPRLRRQRHDGCLDGPRSHPLQARRRAAGLRPRVQRHAQRAPGRGGAGRGDRRHRPRPVPGRRIPRRSWRPTWTP